MYTYKTPSLLDIALLLQTKYLLLLIKQQIEASVALDLQLQALLTWVDQKSCTVAAAYKPVVVRAFYFDLALARSLASIGSSLELARALNPTLTYNLERQLAFDLALDRVLGLDQVLDLTREPNQVVERVLERAIAHARVLDPMLEQALQLLKLQLPGDDDLSKDSNKFKQWWSAYGETWIEQLRAVMIADRNLGHNWQLSEQQKTTLMQYYHANYLLVHYLKSDCYLTTEVREEIEEALLLPSWESCLRFT